ncbi:sn-glycerol-3-phosphate ABC transporter permease UgpA [Azospirillum brasilense]|uniref:sn-glycerol-3-phosphate transport system permease protein UgpA n=1 Tax=Azospirillum brasilense TaxID=192 RepID=A0A0P0F3Y6_AZOBR|nr:MULTISPECIES: sn-glycerol-3-phosphate ABC transporter permease UgpA [Azospirillum]ALJ34340.1 glycerol-3-phosphate transporter permease [Azospirillum brasilense]MDW7556418.1 sn-glycerol-3-phosphate ABC transporter permease UgpA [Azospirillum brasilense]MDW7596170.1 sn-glycerol-3-phosphate ABC transporter permease UgpA [Azospirillum brasilense]MDW7631181.1 sn-glycerol-3-phosphate ABC transporter permease UgpA [Azospirillum brasilense]MDX5952948.1 sn-glycerol-3-phosphate ABC transporter permea
MQRRVIFDNRALPYLLLAPQVAVTLIFFIWPAAQALWQSVHLQDAFGLRSQFVGLENFQAVLSDPNYLETVKTTIVFSASVTVLSLASALGLAVMADSKIRAAAAYKTLLIWPYALAPAVAAVLWMFIFNPDIGILGRALNNLGYAWDYRLNDGQALTMVILAASWKQVSYNFIFFLAGLQAIPRSVLEAASIDGAGAVRRFWTITFPLLSPTTFFLLVVNIVYAFFETFGTIHALTHGGPGKATETLIFRVYQDGVVNHDLGGSSAQSVILMVIVIALTAIQFRFVERKVHYS